MHFLLNNDTILSMDPIAMQRKRLLYRAQYRGTKEADAVLSPYAKRYVPMMNSEELATFETFLTEQDPDIRAWIEERADTPPTYRTIIERMRRL